MTHRKLYTKEYKQEAVRLVRESGKSCAQVARDLGLSESVLGRWRKELEARPDTAFPGQGNAHDAQLRALRRENELLRQEREVLNGAISIFSLPEVSLPEAGSQKL